MKILPLLTLTLVLTLTTLRAADATSGIAVLHPTEGNQVSGVIHFEPVADGKVHVTGTVSGLTPDGEQAFHIHEFGDCSSADGTSAGGHYNPEKHDHALPMKEVRHAGDLGNLKANAEGKATIDITVDNFSINGEKNPIIGRGVIVHAKVDDGGQPTGNAGARVACGVIGWANPGK